MQGRAPRPCGEHGQERFKCPREAQDPPTAVVQPRKEGLPQDTPRCKFSNIRGTTCTLLQWSCGILRMLIFFVWHQATTKDIKDSLGKQWTQLSDKKRLKWITKSLEQRKQYEVTAGSCGRILTSDDDFHLSVIVFNCFFSHIPGDNAAVHPAASRVEHDSG